MMSKHLCLAWLPATLIMIKWKNVQGRLHMEGNLSKKSIHINESFVHAIYIGNVVNSYSDIFAYL